MAVSMNTIPSNLRVPLFWAEMDNSAAGTYEQSYRALLIGQAFKTDAVASVPYLATSEGRVKEIAGQGSMLDRMYQQYRANDSMMELWVLPIADIEGASDKATASFSISGSAKVAGALSFYIAGQAVSVMVSEGALAADIAKDTVLAINGNKDLPVTAAYTGASVTLTCKWAGLSGNSIDLRMNYYGEKLPTGISVSEITAFTGGALNPSIQEALEALSDKEFDFIALAFTDTANLNHAQAFMNNTTGRWSYLQQLYGGFFAAMNAGLAEAQTIGSGRNDEHMCILPVKSVPTPAWEVAAIFTAASAASLSIDPARPLQTLPLVGMMPPAVQERWNIAGRNTLLHNGMSTYSVTDSGQCLIERVITTYQKNAYDVADNSYLDVETLYTSAYVLRFLKQRITQKYGRHKLGSDGGRYGEGQAIVTPKTIKAELIAAYGELETMALVENTNMFKKNLIVERDAANVNRINVLLPPDYVNQLRIFALKNQFRLQYTEQGA